MAAPPLHAKYKRNWNGEVAVAYIIRTLKKDTSQNGFVCVYVNLCAACSTILDYKNHNVYCGKLGNASTYNISIVMATVCALRKHSQVGRYHCVSIMYLC